MSHVNFKNVDVACRYHLFFLSCHIAEKSMTHIIIFLNQCRMSVRPKVPCGN